MGLCCRGTPCSTIGTAHTSISRDSQLPVLGATVRIRNRVAANGCPTPDKLQLRSSIPLLLQPVLSRRLAILCTGVPLVSAIANWNLAPLPVKAEESISKTEEDEGDGGVLGTIKSMFDPDERTKSGKVLPKAYLKSAREVVKTLRASLEEDVKDVAKFRRSADAAKESIREYLNDWRGQPTVATEESYAALVRAIRSLASLYSKSGPFATLPYEVKSSILNDLNSAEAFL